VSLINTHGNLSCRIIELHTPPSNLIYRLLTLIDRRSNRCPLFFYFLHSCSNTGYCYSKTSENDIIKISYPKLDENYITTIPSSNALACPPAGRIYICLFTPDTVFSHALQDTTKSILLFWQTDDIRRPIAIFFTPLKKRAGQVGGKNRCTSQYS
jgi:hypothetical protein